jgi:Tfp pilus assembly protein PilF
MSNKLVAVCVAALTFTACQEPTLARPKPTSMAVVPAPVAPVIASKPTPAPEPVVQPAPERFDAGTPDSLALAHDAPGVDHLARARQLLTDGDPKGALTESRRALFTTPDDEDALAFTAKVSRRVGQPLLAAEAWGRLGRVRSSDALPMLQQARALFQAKDWAGTVIAAREALARDPESAEAYHLAGLGQLSMNELTGAISSFEKAVALSPEHGWALNNLGLACLRANENPRAVEVLGRAVALLPTAAQVQNNYGVALERVGRLEEAKHAYQASMDLSPRYVKARVNAARVARQEVEVDETPDTLSDVPHPLPETH